MKRNSVKLPVTVKKTAPSFVSTRNACKLCAPLGASLVFRGIEGCVPLDSRFTGLCDLYPPLRDQPFQGTHRYRLLEFQRTTAIFGGADNLRIALDNLTRQYRPAAIGIASTCLSETIGDDVRSSRTI
jgi:nitrogenase molybdenum-iron protein NifN